MPIQSIIRKAITDHLVNHVNVVDDKRCRIDILCEQAEQEILEGLKVYEFIYTDCIYESGMWTMSTHFTAKGAYNTMREWLLNRYTEWYENRMIHGKRPFYYYGKFAEHEAWKIKSTIIKP